MHRRLWIAAILFVFAPSVFASDQIHIVEIGLKGYYHPAVPSRVRVAILHSDPRPADVQLRILVHTSFGVERTDTFSTRLSLAPNDQRIVDIPVQLRYSLRATVEVQELDANGRGITEDTQPLELPLTDESLIAVLCSQPTVCQQIQSQISFSGDESAQTAKGKILRFVTLNDPPDEFWGYYPARTLILARPVAEMSAAQRAALEAYIRQGYALIVLEYLSPVSDFLSPYKPGAASLTAKSIGEGRIVWVPSLAGKHLGDLYTGVSLPSAVLGW